MAKKYSNIRNRSPSLLPKPPDWADNIDVCGFGFLSSESSYTPPPEIATFLDSGPKPIYIGFGSIVVDNPDKLTKIVFEAVKKTGQRALVSKGWGNLGADEVPDNILMIGNCPHDWLFRHYCSRPRPRSAHDNCPIFRRSAILGKYRCASRSRASTDTI